MTLPSEYSPSLSRNAPDAQIVSLVLLRVDVILLANPSDVRDLLPLDFIHGNVLNAPVLATRRFQHDTPVPFGVGQQVTLDSVVRHARDARRSRPSPSPQIRRVVKTSRNRVHASGRRGSGYREDAGGLGSGAMSNSVQTSANAEVPTRARGSMVLGIMLR